MKKHVLFVLLAAAAAAEGKAQQNSTFDHYLTQPYFLNPAAAGMNGTTAFFDYRRQWAGFTGAPETQLLTVDGPIQRDKFGLGLIVANDQANIVGSTSANATFAYRAKFSEEHFLRMGVSAGLSQNRILFDKVIAEDPSELQVFKSNQSGTSFDASAGLVYEYHKLTVGLAASHLFAEKTLYENNFAANKLSYQNIPHYLLNAQYRFDLNKSNYAIMPSFQMRAGQGLTPMLEAGVTGFYKNDAWVTLRYAYQTGYTFILGGVIAKNIIAGYAYTISATSLGAYNNGTHDIIIGFRFGKTATSNVADAKAMEDLKRKNEELYETADYLKNNNNDLKKEVDAQKKALKETIYGLDSLKKAMRADQEELKNLIRDNKEKMDHFPDKNPNGQTKPGSADSKDKTADENPGKITAGSIYVVVGASKTLANAKEFQKIVLREYGEETKVIMSESGTWYFVYTASYDNKKLAAQELQRTSKLNVKGLFFGEPWPLVINK
ncbi:MAG TPA: PorP/SprF family type IX secretion system membrane protein [Bacteroidia bacterium]|jgi:type IX secretion system PorP/SprF family membrane protein|nr:PorP/SprF family type IX secretion system membrane protein [Bacteroidia bacterium]